MSDNDDGDCCYPIRGTLSNPYGEQKHEIRSLKNEREGLIAELEEYRSIAERMAAMTQEREEAVETGRQNAVKYAEAEARLQARIVQLETDADAVAWNVSPAMAQATIDQLNEQLTEMQARLVESEKAAYDVAGTIDHMKALLAERDARITELEGDFLIVTEQRLALTAERDAAVREVGRLRESLKNLTPL